MRKKVPAVFVAFFLLLTAAFQIPSSFADTAISDTVVASNPGVSAISDQTDTGITDPTDSAIPGNTAAQGDADSDSGNDPQLISVTGRLRVAASVYLAGVKPPVSLLKPASGLTREVVGYYGSDWAGDTSALDSVSAYGHKMAGVATFSFQLKEDGTFDGQAPAEVIRKTAQAGGKSMALLHNCINGSFDRNIIHKVLNDPAARARTISGIVAIVRNNGFTGVNVDFENIPGADRPVFTRFVSELSRTLHKKGYLVTISVPAKTFDEKTGWGGAFDYKALGVYVDRMMLMTYDEHWFGGPAGPVASTGWVENVVKYAVSQVPAEKVLLGLGMYGYDWNMSTGKSYAALSSVAALRKASQTGAAIRWDDNAQVPYYNYTANGAQHVVWFESNNSAAFKMDMVNRYNLAGVAIWRLGFEDSAFWQMIDNKFSN